MLTLNGQYPFWSIWKNFAFLERMFFLILFAVSLYSLVSATSTMLRLRAMRGLDSSQSLARLNQSLTALNNRVANVRHVIGATFYLFGFVLFCELANISNAVPDFTLHFVLTDFIVHCAFAANVFFILLLLHLVQWLANRRLNSWSERINTRSLA
jgi:hypothetical protein